MSSTRSHDTLELPLTHDTLEESAESTISLDSETCCNLASSRHVPQLSQDLLVVRMQEVEKREDDVENVLLQNNNLMRTMLKKIQTNKQKNHQILESNLELKIQIAELNEELKEKKLDIQTLSNDKNNRATILKIDQAAAAVKDLRDQLYEKDRLIACLKGKVEQELKSMSTEADLLRMELQERENMIIESEKRCKTLTDTLEENQILIENAKDEILKHKKIAEEYKNQLAVTTCQVTELKRYYSMERHVRKQLQAQLKVSDDRTMDSSRYPDTRSGVATSYGATLAASHGHQTAPPTPSFVDYNEYRQY